MINSLIYFLIRIFFDKTDFIITIKLYNLIYIFTYFFISNTKNINTIN